MSDPTSTVLNALLRDGGDGLVIVYYPDFSRREWLLGEIESIAAPAPTVRVECVEEALANPNALVLLVPPNEAETIRELDGSRDRFLDPRRSQPIVLFLLRGGAGTRALTEAASLFSWARGSDVDPESLAEVDVDTERRAFEAESGMTPEAWLDNGRAKAPTDARSLTLSYRARLLERR